MRPAASAAEDGCGRAASERGWSVAVDDRAARRIAEEDLGADRLTGTVGILVAAVRQGHSTRNEADALLTPMVAAGYWAPVTSIDEALASD